MNRWTPWWSKYQERKEPNCTHPSGGMTVLRLNPWYPTNWPWLLREWLA
jgi:hypothetical protein